MERDKQERCKAFVALASKIMVLPKMSLFVFDPVRPGLSVLRTFLMILYPKFSTKLHGKSLGLDLSNTAELHGHSLLEYVGFSLQHRVELERNTCNCKIYDFYMRRA